MKTLVLSSEDLRLLARRVGLDALMDDLVARLTDALHTFDPEVTVVPVRAGFEYHAPHPGLLEWMPCLQGRQVVIKAVGYHPNNPLHQQLPTILSTISAYDTASGHLHCVMDGTFLTALRTGATSAIATRLLAAPRARVLGLIGAGAQAVSQLHGLSRVLELERVLVYDTDPAVQRSFAERIESTFPLSGLRIEPAPLAQLVRSADVLCTATSIGIGEGPVFDAEEEVKPWLHINAVGSDFPGKVEVPRALLQRSFVCPDFPDQAVREGECQQLAPGDIGPALHELVQHADAYAEAPTRMSVFDSTGWALEDQVAMEMFMDYAASLGLGTALQIESVGADAKNPYAFVAARSQPVQPPIAASSSYP